MITPEVEFEFKSPLIASASGLVLHNDSFYLVSDDENAMATLKGESVKIHPVFEGKLPEDPKERKKVKADIESLVLYKEKLILIPSGSKSNRTRGALVELPSMMVTHLSFQNVMSELTSHFKELNIEGAVIVDTSIILFQRGNGSLHENALIRMNLDHFLTDRVSELKITRVTLGERHGTPLSFTDATMKNGFILFLAVAEASESTYLDGSFQGAILGMMNTDGDVLKIYDLNMKSKPEGIALSPTHIYMVTDDDNRKIPSKLYSCPIPSDLF